MSDFVATRNFIDGSGAGQSKRVTSNHLENTNPVVKLCRSMSKFK